VRASQAVSRINKLRVINTDRGIESLPLRHAAWAVEKSGGIALQIAGDRGNFFNFCSPAGNPRTLVDASPDSL